MLLLTYEEIGTRDRNIKTLKAVKLRKLKTLKPIIIHLQIWIKIFYLLRLRTVHVT